MTLPSFMSRRRVRELAVVAAALATASAILPHAADAGTQAATIWPSTATPTLVNASDANAVELGVKFRVDTSGWVAGIRFYKGSQNTGTHTGHLWSSTGQSLASLTFGSESASGWQQAYFVQPVAVTAGRTYIASYHTNVGHYSADVGYFANKGAGSAGSVRALANGVDGGDGVYAYGASRFPSSTFNSTNYWVDVVFNAGGATTTSTTVQPTTTIAPTTVPPTTTTVPPTTTTVPPTTTTVPPTTTTTGVPAQCATGGSYLWSHLEACGWPGASSSGYPAGTSLRTTSPRTITVDGTVIDGERIAGNGVYQTLDIQAHNVTIRNSYITNNTNGAGESSVIHLSPGATVTLDRVTLNGSNTTHLCIDDFGASLDAGHVDCSGVDDGFGFGCFGGPSNCGQLTGDNFNVHDSWLHGFTNSPSVANGHVDGMQTEGAKNGIIRHNTIDNPFDVNSAIALWDGQRSTDSITVDNNLIAGGGFAIYAEDYSPSESNPVGGFSETNVSFTNNRFSTVHFGCVGYWGVWFERPSLAYKGGPTDGWRRTGNKVVETGENIDGGNPHYQGAVCN